MEVIINGDKYIKAPPKAAEGKWLDVTFYDNTSLNREVTIREFFREMLAKLWYDPEGFSGKRPFGNSCWYFPVIYALVEAGAIKGFVTRDEDGYPEDSQFDDKEADKFVQSLIVKLCAGE